MIRTLLGALVAGAVALQPDCPDTPELVTELGRREQVIMDFAPVKDGVETYPSPAQVDARYLRVLVQATAIPDCEWFFNVRDADYRLLQVLDKADFASGATHWTRRVAGDRVLFDLQPCADTRRPTIKFLEYIWMPKEAAHPYYSLQSNVAAYKPITEVDTGRRRSGDFTGFLVSSWLRQAWVCSGVMITHDLFLTNWHCGAPPGLAPAGYWNSDIVRDTLIDLSFDGDNVSRELLVTALVDKDETLDFAILRTRAIDALGPIRPVRISTTPVTVNQQLRLVHHPAGKTKQLSWNCVVSKADYPGWRDTAVKSDFTHLCDTEAGSSGAAVLDESGAVIGLHHLGFDYNRKTCTYLDHENKAVKITAILDHLKTDPKKKPIYDEIVQPR